MKIPLSIWWEVKLSSKGEIWPKGGMIQNHSLPFLWIPCYNPIMKDKYYNFNKLRQYKNNNIKCIYCDGKIYTYWENYERIVCTILKIYNLYHAHLSPIMNTYFYDCASISLCNNVLPNKPDGSILVSSSYSLVFCFSFFWLRGLWDLNSPTRDWTWAPSSGSTES